MKQFKIYENNATKEIQAVKIGWCWPAFFFTWIWAFISKLWVLGGIFLGISIMNSGLSMLSEETALLSMFISIAYGVFFGLKGNELRATSLIKRGLVEKDVLSASNKDSALSLYLSKKQ